MKKPVRVYNMDFIPKCIRNDTTRLKPKYNGTCVTVPQNAGRKIGLAGTIRI